METPPHALRMLLPVGLLALMSLATGRQARPAPATAPASAPLQVVSLTLGKEIGSDKKVVTEQDTFARTDTIYASIGTTGAATDAKLTAKWSFLPKGGGEKLFMTDSLAISPTGEAQSEFHVFNSRGWPTGDYKVELLLDGSSVATKTFHVVQPPQPQ